MGSHKKTRPYLVSLEEADNIISDDLVRCPYCGNPFRSLSVHIRKTHKKSRKEVASEYPKTRYLPRNMNRKLSEGANVWKSNPENLKSLKEMSSRQMTSQWGENSLFRERSITNSTKRIREYNRDYDFRKKMGYHLNSKFDYESRQGEIFKFRSFWELRIAELLDKKNVYWEYESLIVELDENHTYYPDFYIPKHNLILEAHPKHLIDKAMLYKQQRCLEQGYNFKFITESEIVNLESALQCVFE